MKYRKKPIVIEAHQWFKNGDHPGDYDIDADREEASERCEGQIVRQFRHPDISGDTLCPTWAHKNHNHGWIDTLEGGHIVCPADYIITGIKGENYPCKPDIFAQTYDLVD